MDNGIHTRRDQPHANSRLDGGATDAGFQNLCRTAGKLPLIAEPGTKWSYSISLDLLGRVIEVASGMDFETFLQTADFQPVENEQHLFHVPQSEVKRLTSNYACSTAR